MMFTVCIIPKFTHIHSLFRGQLYKMPLLGQKIGRLIAEVTCYTVEPLKQQFRTPKHRVAITRVELIRYCYVGKLLLSVLRIASNTRVNCANKVLNSLRGLFHEEVSFVYNMGYIRLVRTTHFIKVF
jgi:hypothetical protein